MSIQNVGIILLNIIYILLHIIETKKMKFC